MTIIRLILCWTAMARIAMVGLASGSEATNDGQRHATEPADAGEATVRDEAAAVSPEIDERFLDLAREYLAAGSERRRQALAERLATFEGDIDAIVRELSQPRIEPTEPGFYEEEDFSLDSLSTKHPRDYLYFVVPETYSHTKPTGLIIALHGGGRRTPPCRPENFLSFPGQGDDGNQFSRVLDPLGMIVVGPSAPWDHETDFRWCLEKPQEHADYLADVILECKHRFNIDPNRVFLVGHSMGGFGAYHHALVQPDRFAAIIANAGAWRRGYWPAVRGTELCIIHGENDADRGRHHTDFRYAELTNKILTAHGITHEYLPQKDGEHILYRDLIAAYLNNRKDLRRDPYHPRVALATPNGFNDSEWYLAEVHHNRWLTLEKATDGEIEYDRLESNGQWRGPRFALAHKVVRRDGASIEAENLGNNQFVAKTINVSRFSIWLHPQMVDVGKPVTVTLNGKRHVFDENKVKPSLVTALDSYARRNDWGLIYPIRLELEP